MILSHSPHATIDHPVAGQRAQDLSRVGLLLMLKLVLALSIMLLAQADGTAFSPVAQGAPDWHGNAGR